MEPINILLRMGHVFRITPKEIKDRRCTLLEIIQQILVLVLFSAAFVVNIHHYLDHFSVYNFVVLLLRSIGDLTLYFYAFYVIIVSTIFRRRQWFNLVTKLDRLQRRNQSNAHSYNAMIITVLLFILNIILYTCSLLKLPGNHFFKSVSVDLYHLYCSLFYLLFAYVVAKMILERYQQQNLLLFSRDIFFNRMLDQISENMFLLKEIVNVYNNIFGWPLLFHIIATTANAVALLNSITRWEEFQFNTRGIWIQILIANQMILFFMNWTGLLLLISLTDSIEQEYEKILNCLYRLELAPTLPNRHFNPGSSLVEMRRCRPKFTAAGFFVLHSKILFVIFDVALAVLLVAVQM